MYIIALLALYKGRGFYLRSREFAKIKVKPDLT